MQDIIDENSGVLFWRTPLFVEKPFRIRIVINVFQTEYAAPGR